MSDSPKGLAGIVVGQTSICTIDKDGKNLLYRGYSVNDLAENCTFEEVVYLLFVGSLPTSEELQLYKKTFNQNLLIKV